MTRPILFVIAALLTMTTLGYLAGDSKVPDQVFVPSPYPVPSPYEVVVPSPYPVAAPECRRALTDMVAIALRTTTIVADVYSAYTDFPGENLSQFGKRVQAILDADVASGDPPTFTDSDVADCYAAK